MNYKIYFIGFRLISVFFLSHSCICFAQAQVDISTSTVEKFQNFQKSRPAEKVFIHTDRDMFSPGQNLWFKAYVVEATSHKGAAPSNVLYVDLLGPDSSFYIHRVLDVQSGVAHGEMFLPVDMPAGNYVLRGHTRYMQNFPDEYMFRKEISVLDPYQKTPFTNISESAAASQGSNVRKQKPVLDVQFFAEGGHLASNMVNQLAFKALDKNGKGIPVEGAIYSVKNDSLLSFSSNALGMGKVPLFAEKGERYKARVNYNNEEFTFPLPASEDNAYILSGAIRSNVLFVQAANNFNDDMAGAFIVLHIRGHVLHVVEGKGNGHISSKLSTAGLPEGILTMTLFDRAAKPVSERLLFVENPKSGAPVEVKPGAAVYGNRQPVDIQFELAGAVDSVNLSMTIVRQDFAGSMTRENIRTYLLLSSDLQGEIELPGQYFDPANDNRQDDLDALLMTQGWRRISWEEVLSDNPKGVVLPPEEGLSIIGQIVDFYKREEGREGLVHLGLMEDMMFEEEAISDEQGYFIFPNLNYEDTLNFVFQAQKISKRQKKLSNKDPLYIEYLPQPTLTLLSRDSLTLFPDTGGGDFGDLEEQALDYKAAVNKINKIDSAYFARNKIIVLEEVRVEAKKDPWEDPYQRSSAYGEPTHRLAIDEKNANEFVGATPVLNMISRFPGVTVTGSFPNYNVKVRSANSFTGSTQPLFLFDGVPVDIEFMVSLNANEIAYVDLLAGPDAAMYGSRGANGVIAAYSARGGGVTKRNVWNDWGIRMVELVGFNVPREFYVPAYEIKKEEHIKPDFRPTLFWAPDINVLKDKESMVRFYSSDEIGDYVIIIQGVSGNGTPVYQTAGFRVE